MAESSWVRGPREIVLWLHPAYYVKRAKGHLFEEPGLTGLYGRIFALPDFVQLSWRPLGYFEGYVPSVGVLSSHSR